MRFGLRTLMIALILGPPLLGWMVWPAARRLVDWVSPRDAPVQPMPLVNGEWIRREGKDGVLVLEPPPTPPPGNWTYHRGKDGVVIIDAPSF